MISNVQAERQSVSGEEEKCYLRKAEGYSREGNDELERQNGGQANRAQK